MSKDKPEVGDVIMYNGCLDKLKGNIHTVENNLVYSICKDGHKINVCVDTITNFYKRHTYLGKSKANIDDLFKTENEQMIKVGQIYALPWTKNPIVVTDIQYTPKEPFDWIYVISSNGVQSRFWKKTIETLELVAEFDSWQQAVNSPEFKGEK